ncbi:MAG: permease, partial [Chloroflexota bacterium]|nr:permease [Chloroflexota bacterium]
MPAQRAFNAALLFSLAASVAGLVATSLIGSQAVWLRLVLAAIFSPALNRIFVSIVLRRKGNPERQLPKTGPASLTTVLATAEPAPGERRATIIQVIWRSFTVQVERAVIPLLIGFSLASALTIYVPAYTIQPWLGEGAWSGPYLAAFLVTPFQLVGGAEVVLASALLVKGASLGTAMSVMLAAPVTTFTMLRHLSSTTKVRKTALYLVVVWLIAGT